MAKQKGETSQGLIVALVFFILSTIALGVTTYMGYSAQDGIDQKIRDADNKSKAITGDRDWYRAQSMIYRAAMGRLKLKNPEEFVATRNSFVGGTLEKGASDKDEVADVKDLVTSLEQKFPYDDTSKRYRGSYEGIIAEKEIEIQKGLKANTDLRAEKVALETEKKKLEDQLAQQKKAYDDIQVRLNQENKDTKDTQDKNRAALEEKVKELTQQNADVLSTAAEEKKKLLADLKRAIDTVADQKRQLIAVNDELLAIKSRNSDTAPKALRTDWKISAIQGNSYYVNLGTADNVKPQLTFSIHGVGPDGRPSPQPKGTLEIINVMGAKMSQARITSVRDPNRDPILVNDILSNSTWDPFQKRRIALAGYMDIYGDGRDSMNELRRILDRQNVQIDAYLDLKDFTIQGVVTLQTEYLILGDGPESLPIAVRERDGFGKKLGKGLEDIQTEAKKNGVPVMGLRKFLDSIGYKVPRPIGDR